MRELGDVRVDGARRARAARGGRSGVDDEVENSRHGLHDEGGQDGLDAERLQVQDVKPKPSLDEHVEVAGCRRPTTTVPSVHVPNRPHEATESVGYPRGIRGGDPQSVAFSPIGQPRPPGGAHALGHAANAPKAVQGQFGERRCFWRYRGRRAHARASCRAGGVSSRSSLREKPTRKKAIKFPPIEIRRAIKLRIRDTRMRHFFYAFQSEKNRHEIYFRVSSARIFSSAGFYAGYVSDEDQAFCSPQSVRILDISTARRIENRRKVTHRGK